MRRDGLWMISLVRFSYLPGHLVTCIQSTIGISVWVFGIACAISLPKQLALVYLGVLFGESHKLAKEGQAEQAYDEEQTSNTNHKIVSWTVLCVTGFLSVVAMYVIWFRMWQEEKRVAALSVSADESGINESKENLDEVEMQYTLPYLQFPSTERMNRERSSSYASTSASPPTFHTAGRPKMGRSRSSTLTSFAFSNNSLPYLPYTPMLDVQSSNFPMQNRNLPSPIPSAIVSLPSAVQEDDRDPFDEDRSTISSGSDRPYFASGTSQASTPAQSEVSVRARRIRLQRSTSNLLLRDVSSDTKIDMTGGTQIQPNPASASPGPQRMERAASPVGRQRARSRASSYLGPSASSYLGPSQSNVGEGPSQKSRPHPLSGQPSVDIDEPERSA